MLMNLTVQPNPAPRVSIIIPARNEQANMERCLRSLVQQKGVVFEILVVDDGSTDGTRAIAESFTRVRQCPFFEHNQFVIDVRVLDAPQPLPKGWTGKANALAAAEPMAHGEWLLFTDADTEHLPGSLAAAVAEAEEYKADLLSYSPEQILAGVRQRLLMPLIFGELATQYSPSRVNDPALPDAAANGQYLLARASVHRQLGGFASVATELLEDVALARRYKQNGKRIRFRLGRGLVQTRMYSSWGDLRVGWIKNFALLFPNADALARKRSNEFWINLSFLAVTVGFLLPMALRGTTSSYWVVLAITLFGWLFGFASPFYRRVRRAHFPFWPTALSIFGLPLFARLLRESAEAHRKGTVNWRGRAYSTNGTEAHTAASNPK